MSIMGSYIKNIEKYYFLGEKESDNYTALPPAMSEVLAQN
jgi:hypothetical protein